MKVLHIITSLKIGGAESALYNFLEYITAKKSDLASHHYVAYFHHGPNVEKINSLGIKTYHIKGLIFIYDPLFFICLKRVICKISPNIIHTALWSANIIGRLLGKYIEIPVICDLHGNSFHEGYFRNKLDQHTVGLAYKNIAVSNSVIEAYQKNIIKNFHKKSLQKKVFSRVVVIQNGIDVKLIRNKTVNQKSFRSKIGLNKNDFVIGTVGRLDPIKSYDVLIKAFSMFFENYKTIFTPEFQHPKLCIVGEGKDEQKLKYLSERFNLTKHVIFAGAHPDAYKFYPLFSCFVLSSQSEGLSIALLEALAFGLPVITTNNGSTHEVISDKINGFLVPINNPNKLAEAFIKLYNNQPLLIKMKAANKQLVEKFFNIEKVVYNYKKIYQEVFVKTKIDMVK
jgi:glycosyltransferase involved in cell wall biosynthesis